MSSFVHKDHVAIEFFIPPVSNWIWGVSRWDSGDVWGGSSSAAAWTDLKCETYQVETVSGNDVDSGVFVKPTIGQATISMQSVEYDPFVHGTIHVGTPVRVLMKNMGEWTTETEWPLFTGTISSFSVSYDAWGRNSIKIIAVDAMQQFLNTPVASYSTTGSQYDADIITNLANLYWPTTWGSEDAGRSLIIPAKTWTNTTVGQIVSEITDAGLGILYCDTNGSGYYLSQTSFDNWQTATPVFYFSSTHSTATSHICMSDLKWSANSQATPNTINITDTLGTTYQRKNQDAIDLYGPIALNADLLITGSTAVSNWFSLITPTNNSRRVETIQFPAVTREGKPVTLNNYTYYGGYFYQAMNVEYNKGGIDLNENYIITKFRQNIDPDNWLTTVEMWKGI